MGWGSEPVQYRKSSYRTSDRSRMHPHVRLLGGRYELAGLIASGGMGQVWQARDTRLGRDVAVKVLRSEYTGDPTFLARFRAEAQLAAGLVHPNIATLFDYGEDRSDVGEHLAYLVMELVRGESLSALLYREITLSPDRTLDVLRQSAAGLAAAHATGVVHRDVKPGNVLIGADGTVKITDFGVAVSGSSVPLTQTGQVIGTPHYLAPEQAAGHRATPASDVYALGAIGYMCLTGRRVFDAESSLQVMLLQLNGTPDPLPDDVPEPVRLLVESALVKDPAERFPDGGAFRDAIDDVIAGRPLRRTLPYSPTAVLPVSRTDDPAPLDDEPPVRHGHRRRVLAALLALVVLAVAVVLGVQAVGGPGDAGEAVADTAAPSSTAPSSTAPASTAPASTAPATPSVQPVLLASADLVGRPYAEVQAELTGRGLVVTLRPLQTGDVPDGQVIAVDPTGELTVGSPVTVTYAVAPTVVAPAPTPDPAPAPDAGQTVVTVPAPAAGPAGPAPAPGDGNANGKGDGKGNGKGNGKG